MSDTNIKDISMMKDKGRPLEMREAAGSFIFSSKDMNVVLKEIGKNVGKYRMKYGLSIEELANLAGITKGTLYKIEKGSAAIGLIVLLKISYVLQLPLDAFVPFYFPDREKRKSMGETIDEITYGLSAQSRLFVLNLVKNFVKYDVRR